MKQQRTIILGAVLAVLLMAAPFAAQARPGGFGCGFGPGAWQQSVPQEKRDAMFAMMREHQAKVQPLYDELWAKRTLMDALSVNPNADVKEIKALIGDMSALRAKVRAEHTVFAAQVKKEIGVDIPCGMNGMGPMGGMSGMGGDGFGRHRGHGGYGGGGGRGPCGW